MTISMPQGATMPPFDGAVGALASPYAVKLSVFEGPLDLLLHLIRQNEVEITDIPIAEISEQYLAYLDVMRELNLDVVGDYLVMAATLAWIKSRMLLPAETTGEDGEEIDPRAELIARLLEYQRFKEAAEELRERQILGRDVFEARGPAPEAAPEAEREIEVGLIQLLDAFRKVLRAAQSADLRHEVATEIITVRERMIAVMDALQTRDVVEFEQIFRVEEGISPSRTMIVVTFLAILELVRLSALRVYQGMGEHGGPEGPIHVRLVGEGRDGRWQEHIAEIT
jgi:segregation and condensation protein A